jgi:hypothetical protein
METTTLAALVAIIWGAIMLIANKLGRYFTEGRPPFFNYKPWNCRECFTYWLTLILGFIAAGLLAAPAWTLHGVCMALSIICAFLNYIIIKSNIQINE